MALTISTVKIVLKRDQNLKDFIVFQYVFWQHVMEGTLMIFLGIDSLDIKLVVRTVI